MTRLLPWPGEGGQPAYLTMEDDCSFLSRLADNLETRQLGMAKDLQDFVDTVMNGDKPSETELRSMVSQLSQALRDTRCVAESRGDRLPQQDEDADTAAADAAMQREIATCWGDAWTVGALPAVSEERPGLVVRRWTNEPECVSGARRILRLYLDRWGMGTLADTAALVLSELFGNAVQHAPGSADSLIETRFERLPNGQAGCGGSPLPTPPVHDPRRPHEALRGGARPCFPYQREERGEVGDGRRAGGGPARSQAEYWWAE